MYMPVYATFPLDLFVYTFFARFELSGVKSTLHRGWQLTRWLGQKQSLFGPQYKIRVCPKVQKMMAFDGKKWVQKCKKKKTPKLRGGPYVRCIASKRRVYGGVRVCRCSCVAVCALYKTCTGASGVIEGKLIIAIATVRDQDISFGFVFCAPNEK